VIIEALVNAIVGLLSAVGDLFGHLDMPSWWASVDGAIATVSGYAAGFGFWFPFSAAVNGLEFVVACIGIGLLIKVIRIVASFFTAGGGSAA
jgi:hypothetical protein